MNEAEVHDMTSTPKAQAHVLLSRNALFRGGRWIDRWDELKAASDEDFKSPGEMAVGANLAFSQADGNTTLQELVRLSDMTCADSAAYYSSHGYTPNYDYHDGKLSFNSYIQTETPQNNIVRATVFPAREGSNALVILPHWNAKYGGYASLARHLVRLGITIVEMTLPYHGPRNRSGATSSDYFLSANIGRTIRSVRQSVIDCRCVIDWLQARGYGRIGLVGLSLGSCVGGLVAEHDPRVSTSALFLTAGDFAEVVWTGRSTRLIAKALAPHVTLSDLRRLWSIISTDSFVPSLARPNHKLLMISGRRDPVVLPYLTQRFVERLRAAGVDLRIHEMGCGHYSIRLFPYNVLSFASLARFLFYSGMLKM